VKQKLSDNEKYVGFHCPIKLLEVFDEVIKGRYSHRTNALLDAMRDLIRKVEEQKRQREAA
jgi:metal-responsive CopG/Arc/MetJ family transcriptional regulator